MVLGTVPLVKRAPAVCGDESFVDRHQVVAPLESEILPIQLFDLRHPARLVKTSTAMFDARRTSKPLSPDANIWIKHSDDNLAHTAFDETCRTGNLPDGSGLYTGFQVV